MGVSERGQKLKQQVLACAPSISAERLEIVSRAYRDFEGDCAIVKRARTLQRILERKTLYILDGELIVGNQAPRPRCAEIFAEFSVSWIIDELDSFSLRDSDAFEIDEVTKARLRELLPWWRGRTVQERAIAELPPECYAAHRELVYILTSLASGVGHIAVDYRRAIGRGLRSITEEAAEAAAAIHGGGAQELRRRQFYQAVQIVCRAVIAFAGRFARYARELAGSESDAVRRGELEQIARVCDRVPQYPARSFHEALQAFWFVHLVLQIESNGHSISPGRFDQYLFPYYRQDLEAGRITQESAAELLENVWVKLNEINKLRDKVGSKAFGGYPMFQNLIVGGVDADGKDATNDLSYLCMQVTRQLRLPQPSLSLRWHTAAGRRLLHEAAGVVRAGVGMPAFFNDEVIVPILLDIGCSLEEARDYAEVGCVEPQAAGKTDGYYPAGFLNLAKVLELTLHNGTNPISGSAIGIAGGADFSDYSAFQRAYFAQLEHFCGLMATSVNIIDGVHAREVPTPFCSCFVDDCLQRGTDIRHGGARHNYASPNAVAIANVADSLVALKKAVFEQNRLSYRDLVGILRQDFEGHEELRQRLLNNYPKYGNDHEEVDLVAREIASFLSHCFREKQNARGGRFHVGLQSISAHALFVNSIGATPDGRKRSMLLADGGCSPAQGRDRLGPTAILKSVAQLDQYRIPNGALLNIKLHPSLLEGNSGAEQLAALVESYFMLKGQHVQFNVVSTQTLRAAQKDPQEYGDLVVRVAGFSVFFVTLDRILQEDIIQRTEQSRN